MKYVYPAIFTPIEKGGYVVEFPDIEGCFTSGESLDDAIEMAKDVLPLMLCSLEDRGAEIPKSTSALVWKLEEGEFTRLIDCDTDEYRKEVGWGLQG